MQDYLKLAKENTNLDGLTLASQLATENAILDGSQLRLSQIQQSLTKQMETLSSLSLTLMASQVNASPK
jgi:hypothetical protein